MSGGGSSGGSKGAPDFYYEHLAEAGEQETELARELMNFYKRGSFQPEANQAAINETVEGMVGKTGGGYKRVENPGYVQGMPGGEQDRYTWREVPSDYTVTGSDETYSSREEAMEAAREMVGRNPDQYGLEAEGYSGPSLADMERRQIQANYNLIPQQTAMQTSQMQSAMDSSIWGGGGDGAGRTSGASSGGRPSAPAPKTTGSPEEVVRSHYQELFGREPTQESLDYWVGQVESRQDYPGQLQEAMLAAAADEDKERYRQQQVGAGNPGESQFTHQARLMRDQIEQKRKTLPVAGKTERMSLREKQKTLPVAGKTERIGLREKQKTLPVAGETERIGLREKQKTLPVAGETQRMGLEEQQQVIRQRAPVLREYFQEARNVDPNQWANRAQAETAQQFGQARDQATRNIARTGATPGSGRASAMMGDLATRQAKATSAAKNIARRRGEKEKFNRLSQAVGGAGSIGG